MNYRTPIPPDRITFARHRSQRHMYILTATITHVSTLQNANIELLRRRAAHIRYGIPDCRRAGFACPDAHLALLGSQFRYIRLRHLLSGFRYQNLDRLKNPRAPVLRVGIRRQPVERALFDVWRQRSALSSIPRFREFRLGDFGAFGEDLMAACFSFVSPVVRSIVQLPTPLSVRVKPNRPRHYSAACGMKGLPIGISFARFA